MTKNRKKAEDYILNWVEKLLPGGGNKEIYQNLFSSMPDVEFERFMKDIEEGRKHLTIVAPNYGKAKLNLERNLSLAKDLGHNFFQRLWIDSKNGEPAYLTPIPYLVVDLPLRRTSQLLIKKISVPDHNRTVDMLSGQPTGDSKGSKISYPELQVLAAMGMDNSITELIKYRGGDVRGFNAMNSMISKYGTANQKTLANYASGVESTRTLKTFLTCMHLKNTL